MARPVLPARAPSHGKERTPRFRTMTPPPQHTLPCPECQYGRAIHHTSRLPSIREILACPICGFRRIHQVNERGLPETVIIGPHGAIAYSDQKTAGMVTCAEDPKHRQMFIRRSLRGQDYNWAYVAVKDHRGVWHIVGLAGQIDARTQVLNSREDS